MTLRTPSSQEPESVAVFVSTPSSELSVEPARVFAPLRKNAALVLVIVGIVAVAAGQVWRLQSEARYFRSLEAERASLALVLPDVLKEATRVYAAGSQPMGSLNVREQHFRSAKKRLANDFERFHVVWNQSGRLGDFGVFETAVEELESQVEKAFEELRGEPSRPPGRAGAASRLQLMGDAYWEVVRIHDRVAEAFLQDASTIGEQRADAELLATQMGGLFALGLIVLAGVAAWRGWKLAEQLRHAGEAKQKLIGELRESEAKYRSIFSNAVEGMFQTTPDGKFITANMALAKMYGFKSPEELIEKLTDIGMQLYVDASQREALLAALQAEDVVSNFEFEVTRVDGRSIWLRENVRAVRDKSGKIAYLEGTVEDVSNHWWAEQRRRLQYATTKVFNESASLAQARSKILQTICEIVDWDLGAVWAVNASERCLECDEIWHTPEVDVADFEDANSNTTYPLGHGLAGEVWRTGEPKWIANLAEEHSFPNAAIAVKAGMGSAFGVPITVRGEVQHVLEFFSPKISLPDPELLQTLSAISNQLGHLFERKLSEEALRGSELRKAAIVQSALDCILSYDAEGSITEFNPAAERAFGRPRSDVIGKRVDEVILPPDLREYERAALGLVAKSLYGLGAGRRFELVARRGDGSEFPAEIALSRIVVEGQPMFTAYLRDVSERRAAERLTSELAAVVANSNDAIASCTLDGVIRSWNAGAEEIFGYTADDAIGRPLHMLMPSERLDEFPEMLRAVQRGESHSNYETQRVRKDGRKIFVSVTDSPIRGEAGLVVGVSSIARDITDRKRLEGELLQSQKMEAIGRLAGGIAHDFNNILTAILGYSDLLLGQIEERHWMWKHLNEIRKASDFAASLTHQLLAFSRRQPLFPRVFSVNDSVRHMEKMLQRLLGEQIRVRTELRAEIGRVKADPTQLEQVLLNLCVNSRDAMPSGGMLTVTTSEIRHSQEGSSNDMPDGEYVKLVVSDTGAGIRPEVIKHVFEPFFTTKEKGHGTGLGLATCYGIVKQSGGYITVESVVGSGTTFSIYLPKAEDNGEYPTLQKDLAVLPRGKETILYVEDEMSVRRLTSHVLRKLGYTVIEASDGKQALDVVEGAEGDSIDLLFTDVILPDYNGKELSDWMNQRIGAKPVLYCSGYIDDNLIKRHELGDDRTFLQKPFSPSDLATKVREAIDGRS